MEPAAVIRLAAALAAALTAAFVAGFLAGAFAELLWYDKEED